MKCKFGAVFFAVSYLCTRVCSFGTRAYVNSGQMKLRNELQFGHFSLSLTPLLSQYGPEDEPHQIVKCIKICHSYNTMHAPLIWLHDIFVEFWVSIKNKFRLEIAMRRKNHIQNGKKVKFLLNFVRMEKGFFLTRLIIGLQLEWASI